MVFHDVGPKQELSTMVSGSFERQKLSRDIKFKSREEMVLCTQQLIQYQRERKNKIDSEASSGMRYTHTHQAKISAMHQANVHIQT